MKEFQETFQSLQKSYDLLRDEIRFLKDRIAALEKRREEFEEKEVKSINLLERMEMVRVHKKIFQTKFSLPDQAPFQTLGQISEDEKIDIIKTGFRLKKKYYEGFFNFEVIESNTKAFVGQNYI